MSVIQRWRGSAYEIWMIVMDRQGGVISSGSQTHSGTKRVRRFLQRECIVWRKRLQQPLAIAMGSAALASVLTWVLGRLGGGA